MIDRTTLAVLLAVLVAPGLFADDAPVGDEGVAVPAATVYATATVIERPLESATAAVTVIGRAEVEALGALTVADVLAFVPGVGLNSAGTRAGLTTVQIRGGDPNFTLVLLDGVPMNDGTYPVGEVFDLESLPAAAVERIEVVRGPLSSFYGSTGLAGAIHVLTGGGADGPRGRLELAAGDASYGRAHASLGDAGDGRDYFLSALGERESERVAGERFRLGQLQGRLGLEPSSRIALRLAGRVARWRADDYPEASGGPLFGDGELRRGDHDEASVGLELVARDGGGRRHKLSAALYRHDFDRDSPAVPPLVPASIESTRWLRGRAGWAVTLEPRPGWRVSAGVDAQREDGENESVLFLPPFLGGEVRGDYDLARTTPGAYGELVVGRGRLTLELGLRADVPERAGDQLSPRLGLSWRPGDGETVVRASAGRAFKLPSFFALASPPALGGNPALRPEVMVGGDVGVERRLAGSSGRALTLSATVYVHRFRDLVDFDFETFSHVNRSRVDARGVELALVWRPRGVLGVATQVGWQDVEDVATGLELRHRPRWLGGARVDWRPRRDLDLHLDLRFSSSQRDEQLPVRDRFAVDGRALLGAHAAWRFAPAWRLDARVDNLADESYETLIGFPGPGRSVWLALGRGFGSGTASRGGS